MIPIDIVERGLQDYAACFDEMQTFTAQRGADTPDTIWLVEHPPVFTLGLAGDPAHLLAAGNIPLVKVDRGGQITYHGPGQVVAYLLLDLRRRGLFVKALVDAIEAAVIETLATYNVASERKAGAPGIYLSNGPDQGAKIAALGLKIRNGCSYHGVSLNLAMDLAPFTQINPCGYAGLETVDMVTAGARDASGRAVDASDWQPVSRELANALVAQLQQRAQAQPAEAATA
ncbi:lipoyl(octanoyl) transferase LipB [Ralstonia sp. R-29]|uniref:lipoyl(octanoyl) transferase LipB n=1 Tax=Ralstonia sp. R-29 TaxID=3404059 RepID=UPI003CF7B76A